MEHFLFRKSARKLFRENRYTLQEKLGSGGMGEVYVAWDNEAGRRVALKLIHKAGTRRELRRFIKEFETLRSLAHPHVVRVYDWGEEEEYAYFTMDYIDGKTIDLHFLGTPAIYLAAGFIDILAGVAEALAYLHGNAIIHRDLKPQNILVRSDGSPVLLDFGLVKQLEELKASITMEGDFMGTFVYSPPEQLTGEELTPASDIYSLGLIVYELLASQVPLWAENPMATLHLRTTREPVPLHRFDPLIPAELASMVMKMLERLPAQRHADGAALLEDLASYRELLDSGELHERAAHGAPPEVLTMSRIEQLLSEMPFFDSLDENDRYKIAVYAGEQSFCAGERIFGQGDPGDALYVVLQGEVEIRFEPNPGHSERILVLGEGEIFGEIALFTGEPRTASVYAFKDCNLLVLAKEDMDWLLLKNPSLALAMIRVISLRLSQETRLHRLKK